MLYAVKNTKTIQNVKQWAPLLPGNKKGPQPKLRAQGV